MVESRHHSTDASGLWHEITNSDEVCSSEVVQSPVSSDDQFEAKSCQVSQLLSFVASLSLLAW